MTLPVDLQALYKQGRYDFKMDLLNKIEEEIDIHGWADERLGLELVKVLLSDME